MKHPLLLNQKNQQVEFDPSKRFFFIDIDGVLNPLNYKERWIGPKGPSYGIYDPELHNPKNWTIDVLPIDPEIAFPPDRDLIFQKDRWADHPDEWIQSLSQDEAAVAKRYRKIKVHVATELIESLKNLISKHDLQVVYLSYWKSEALRLLEPEIELGAIGHLDWFTGSDLGAERKLDSLSMFIADSEIERPYVFLDDQATRRLDHPESRIFDQSSSRFENVPRILMDVDPELGLTRENLRRLDEFFTLNP